ncbi:MAG TPA: hypothetical protein PKC28_01905 [Bdellovibrionales bacterium]|nr:hypothetical protein [Bdellovibrionales bacterium]
MSRFEDRSYSGKLLRPTPEIHLEEDGSFGVIATPWGGRASARKVIDTLKDFVLSARQDNEATSPFQKLSTLSPLANSLRAGIMLANDLIYREENKAEYLSGVEVLAFAHLEGELAFAQVGYPHLFLLRAGLPWIPLSVQIDLATEMSRPPKILPPIPQNLIGLHTTTNLNISSLKTQPGDRLAFLSHSVVSHPLFGMNADQSDLDSISQSLSRGHPDLPFWLGLLAL